MQVNKASVSEIKNSLNPLVHEWNAEDFYNSLIKNNIPIPQTIKEFIKEYEHFRIRYFKDANKEKLMFSMDEAINDMYCN